MLQLPESAQRQSGLTHFTMFWEAHGHPPTPYLTPHFDFHFYTIPTGERAAIDCADTTKPAAFPAGYGMADVEIPGIGTLIGLCVPAMGMHALLESEMNGQDLFTGTMVIGYDRGTPLFFEPMLTRGAAEWDLWSDDWTVVTRDRSLTAQFEHTIVVTERGADILTLP